MPSRIPPELLHRHDPLVPEALLISRQAFADLDEQAQLDLKANLKANLHYWLIEVETCTINLLNHTPEDDRDHATWLLAQSMLEILKTLTQPRTRDAYVVKMQRFVNRMARGKPKP